VDWPEAVALIRACSSRAPTGVRNRALIAVTRRLGLRISEALRLELREIDPRASRQGRQVRDARDRRVDGRALGAGGTAINVIRDARGHTLLSGHRPLPPRRCPHPRHRHNGRPEVEHRQALLFYAHCGHPPPIRCPRASRCPQGRQAPRSRDRRQETAPPGRAGRASRYSSDHSPKPRRDLAGRRRRARGIELTDLAPQGAAPAPRGAPAVFNLHRSGAGLPPPEQLSGGAALSE
jgi:hypothetical protein